MRDFITLRIAMLGVACVSTASCTPPTPKSTPKTSSVDCLDNSSYAGPKLPYVDRDVYVTGTAGSVITVKPVPHSAQYYLPGLCIDSGGNIHIYKHDADEIRIHFRLDPKSWHLGP